MKSLRSKLYSPHLTFVNESIEGVTTIKSYNKTREFTAKYSHLKDVNTDSSIIESGVISWLEIRLKLITMLFIGFSYLY